MLAFLSVANVSATLTADSIASSASTSLVNGGKYVIGTSGGYYLAATDGSWGSAVAIGSAYVFTVHGDASAFYATCQAGTLKTGSNKGWGGYDSSTSSNLKLNNSGDILPSGTATQPFLKSNSGSSNKFRWYNSGQTAVYFYQIGYNVIFTQPAQATGGSIAATSSFASYDATNSIMAGVQRTKTLTLTATPPSGKVVDAWTVKKKSDNTDVTSTVLSGTTLTMPAYDVVVSVTWKNSAACSNQLTLTKVAPTNGSFFVSH